MIFVPTEKKLNWKSPPIVLCCLVLLNVLIFLFYQTDDNSKFDSALEHYSNERLIALEWRAYRDFVFEEHGERLSETKPENGEDEYYSVLLDKKFVSFLQENQSLYIHKVNQEKWMQARTKVAELINSVSYYKFGLIPSESAPFTFITYQFLHGSVMHLIGNMVFLILFGFAVEASLGSIRFLLYYLVGGIGAAGLFTLLNLGSSTPLLGASGSVSAVMAMYICLYKAKKIEFFYWVLIFVGYVRAPAILLLPIYIGFEIFQAYTIEGSNVAYSAHIGGFITGAILVMLTQMFMQQSIDEEYLNNDEQKNDPYLKGLESVYKEIANFRLRNAYEINKSLIEKYGQRVELQEIQFNLLQGLSKTALKKFLLSSLGQTQDSRKIIEAQWQLWKKMEPSEKQQITIQNKILFAKASLDYSIEQAAISVYEEIAVNTADDSQGLLSSLAIRISQFYQADGQANNAKKYFNLSQQGAHI